MSSSVRRIDRCVSFSLLCKSKGFSLFELVVVLCVVAFLAALALSYYQKNFDSSLKKHLHFQSATFLRAVENVRAISVLQKTRVVELAPGVYIHVNRHGWPQSASNKSVRALSKPSIASCESLLNDLFTTPKTGISNTSSNDSNRFITSLEENEICRYTLSRKQEGSYFFDYDLRNGTVNVFSPE